MTSRKQSFDLFWLSACMLFFELMMIRWLSSELRIFAYFHNLVLVFCFLGIGLGCALCGRKARLWWPFAVIAFFSAILWLDPFLGPFSLRRITPYLSTAADIVIWGKGFAGSWIHFTLVQAAGLILFFTTVGLIAVCFVPFGQLLGKMLNEAEHPLRAYGVNLAGSLAGILLFNALSFYWTPPSVWLALGGVGTLYFLRKEKRTLIHAAAALALAVGGAFGGDAMNGDTFWSPYQKLTVRPAEVEVEGERVVYGNLIRVNGTAYQQITNYSPEFVNRYPQLFPADEVPYDHYNIPFRFAGGLGHVLIVGAGAGNDAAGALRNEARRVTAVDIDPLILWLGRRLHPERPYADGRVRLVADDARSFFKRTKERYDLIIFGLLDSHTLSSSFSNVRLDNYVYTRESLRDAKNLLKPGGVMSVIFEVTDPFIGQRIQRMMARVFGREPIGFEVRSGFRGWGGVGFVAGDREVIAARLSADPILKRVVERQKPRTDSWARAEVAEATDDWPYLYLPGRQIPSLYWEIYVLVFLLTYYGVRTRFPERGRLDWHFFFLGAGFLLIEVQNVSKLALLFGTTWTVNSIVISAILVMIMAANAFAMRVRVNSLAPYYGFLLLSLGLNYLIPLSAYSALGDVSKALIAGGVMALPVFFAGIIFSTSFSRAGDRSSAFASNLLGAMLGGMLESASFVTGIKALLIVAGLLYVLSFLGNGRAPQRA